MVSKNAKMRFVRAANRNFTRFIERREVFPQYVPCEITREDAGIGDYQTDIYVPEKSSKSVKVTCSYNGLPFKFDVSLWSMISPLDQKFEEFEATRGKLEKALGRGSIRDFGLVRRHLQIDVFRKIDTDYDEIIGMQEAFLTARDEVLEPLIDYFIKTMGWSKGQPKKPKPRQP